MPRYRTNIEFECSERDFPKVCNALTEIFESEVLSSKTKFPLIDMPKEIEDVMGKIIKEVQESRKKQ